MSMWYLRIAGTDLISCIPGTISGCLDQYPDTWSSSLMSKDGQVISVLSYLLSLKYSFFGRHICCYNAYEASHDIYKYFTFGNHISSLTSMIPCVFLVWKTSLVMFRQCYHCICYVKMIEVRGNMKFWSCDTTGAAVGIMMLTASSVAPLNLLGQDNQNKV